jgi:hypothetical protein
VGDSDVADLMARRAFIQVQAAREASGGLLLDYSPDSLAVLDGLIQQTMPRLRTDPEVAEVVGAYVGEVLRRRTGGRWCLVDGRPRLSTADGTLLDPVERARLRLVHGRRYALAHYARLVAEGVPVPEARPVSGFLFGRGHPGG